MSEDTWLRDLEAQLRRVPKPKAPSGLEDRLLATIPSASRGRLYVVRKVWPWLAGAATAAAAVVLAVLWMGRPLPPSPSPAAAGMISPDQAARAVDNEGQAARMLAVADILARSPGCQEQAQWNRQYVLREYADTQAAKKLLGAPKAAPAPQAPTTKENGNG